MKTIASLLLASVAILTFNSASAAERWGWDDMTDATAPAVASNWVPAGALGGYAAGATGVEIVPLPLGPAATKAPGVLAVAMPQLSEAIDAVRAVVAQDPELLGTLKARGLELDDVVGLANAPTGVTLFVADRAA